MQNYEDRLTQYLSNNEKNNYINYSYKFFYLQKTLLANVVEIKFKIQDEIITNIDIENEKKYLFFLNNKLQDLDKSKINKIAIDSLINEIIKKKEVEKNIRY